MYTGSSPREPTISSYMYARTPSTMTAARRVSSRRQRVSRSQGTRLAILSPKNLADKRTRAFLLRVVENLFGRAFFDDHSRVDEEDSARHVAREAHLMGYDDHGHPLPVQRGHHADALADAFRIEPSGRLGAVHRFGVHREC